MASLAHSVSVLQVLLWLLLLFSRHSLCRELVIEEPQFWKALCNNTVQGRNLRSDDQGYVCNIRDIHPRTGCCTDAPERYSCLGCNMASQCCSMYEYCVSCCLDPSRTSSEVALKAKVAKQLTAGEYTFQVQALQYSSTVQVDVDTIQQVWSMRIHMLAMSIIVFPQEQYPDEGPERGDADFGGLTIVIARQGQSCESACSERQKVCRLSTLSVLNKCSILKKYLNCKEACIASTGTDQPSEVVKTAPKHMNPGSCMFNTQKVPFSCQGSHPYTRRLCPCGSRYVQLYSDGSDCLVQPGHPGSASLVPSTGDLLVEKEVNIDAEVLSRS